MPRYCVFMHGQDYRISREAKPDVIGFFTTRVMDAANPEDASQRAVESVRHELQERGVPTAQGLIEVESVERTSWWWRRLRPPAGFTFYTAGSGDEEGIEEWPE